MFYSGSPFVYGIADAGTNCKAVGRRVIVPTGNFLAWMGENAFYIYDGTVREIPCDVHDYVFDNLNVPAKVLVGVDITLTSMRYGGDSQAVTLNTHPINM